VITWKQFSTQTHEEWLAERDRRRQLMAQLVQVSEHEIFVNSFRVRRRLGLYVEHIFDEVNDAIGQAWFWDTEYFYFVRESDVVWFSMRWM
jgi:hypothetical protein